MARSKKINEAVESVKVDDSNPIQENYYMPETGKMEFFSTGSVLLDCCLGGGWVERRMFNLVGSKMSNKTGLCLEACINFKHKYPNGKIVYIETEAATDLAHAAEIGLRFNDSDIKLIDDITIIEEVYNKIVELTGVVDTEDVTDSKLQWKGMQLNTIPTLVIVDSWDALSDAAEMERGIEDGSYAMNKVKQSHSLFRRMVKKASMSNLTLGIVSQERDNIGVTFGNKTTIACKRPIEHYASQRVQLTVKGQIPLTIDGITRTEGVNLKATVIKNRAGKPFRSCDLPLYFTMGVDDLGSCVEFLEQIKKLSEFNFNKYDIEVPKRLSTLIDKIITNDKFKEIRQELSRFTVEKWKEVEGKFKPPYQKYE